MEPTSEQKLKQLLEEGKISEDEYRQLRGAMDKQKHCVKAFQNASQKQPKTPNRRDVFIYRYGPILIIVTCAIMIKMLSMFQLYVLSGYVFTVVLPLCLLSWVVYFALKDKTFLLKSYYLLIVWIFCILFFASIWAFTARIFDETGKERFHDFVVNYLAIGLFVILAVWQIFAKRYYKKHSQQQYP